MKNDKQSWITRRPLVFWMAALAAGIALAEKAELTCAVVVCLACCLFVTLTMVWRARRLWWLPIACLLFAGGFCYAQVRLHPTYMDLVHGHVYLLRGTVSSLEAGPGETTIELDDAQADGRYLNMRVLLQVQETVHAKAGDCITCKAEIGIPAENWDGFSYRTYLLGQNIGYTARTSQTVVTEGPARIQDIPAKCAAWLGERMDALYGTYAGTIKGMVLGDTTAMNETVLADFRAAGIQHVLSVSGLHVSVIAAAIGFLFQGLRLRAGVRFLLMTAAIWFYCLVVGAPPSAIRACLMSNVMMGAGLFRRKPDTWNSIALAALAILLYDPLQLFHAGFLMSFGAAIGIAMVYRPLCDLLRRIHIPRRIAQAVALSVSAQVGIAPMTMHLFGTVQVLSVFPNLIIVPLASVITVMALVFCLLGPLGQTLALAVNGMVWAMQSMAGIFSTLPTTRLYPLPAPIVPLMHTGVFVWTRCFHPPKTGIRFAVCGVLFAAVITILIV